MRHRVFGILLLCAATPLHAQILLLQTTAGPILIELRPEFAPKAVARIIQLTHEHVYDGLLFHRVVPHFVDQTGNPNNKDGGTSTHPNLPPEFRFSLAPSQITAIATRGPGGITGFVGHTPFAATFNPQNPTQYRAWGIYCAGVAGMGRGEGPDTANSEIFLMREENRSLDHDYTVWGRVIAGQPTVTAIAPGDPPAHPDRILSARLLAEIPAAERPTLPTTDTNAPAFAALIGKTRAQRGADFSVCDVPTTPPP